MPEEGRDQRPELPRSERTMISQLIVMTPRLGAIALVGVMWTLAGCNAGGPINVISYYGPGIKFSGLGTSYAWTPNQPEHTIGAASFHELVRNSVDKHLASRGFASNTAGTVDFWVDFRLGRGQKTYAGAIAHGETIEVGSLVLEVFDPASRKLIWRGIAETRIFGSDTPEVRKQRLEAAMSALMAKFPAK
jgi:hypothetical protein